MKQTHRGAILSLSSRSIFTNRCYGIIWLFRKQTDVMGGELQSFKFTGDVLSKIAIWFTGDIRSKIAIWFTGDILSKIAIWFTGDIRSKIAIWFTGDIHLKRTVPYLFVILYNTAPLEKKRVKIKWVLLQISIICVLLFLFLLLMWSPFQTDSLEPSYFCETITCHQGHVQPDFCVIPDIFLRIQNEQGQYV